MLKSGKFFLISMLLVVSILLSSIVSGHMGFPLNPTSYQWLKEELRESSRIGHSYSREELESETARVVPPDPLGGWEFRVAALNYRPWLVLIFALVVFAVVRPAPLVAAASTLMVSLLLYLVPLNSVLAYLWAALLLYFVLRLCAKFLLKTDGARKFFD